MATHRVRTSMRPWEEIEVDDAELLDLERQGLVISQDDAEDESVKEGDEQ